MIKMCAKQLGLCEFYITFSTLRFCSFWGYLLLTMLSFLAVDKNKEEFKNGAKLNIDSAYPFLHLQPSLNKLKQKKTIILRVSQDKDADCSLLYTHSISQIIKCSEKCARRDWSEQVHYISIKYAHSVTRVHC